MNEDRGVYEELREKTLKYGKYKYLAPAIPSKGIPRFLRAPESIVPSPQNVEGRVKATIVRVFGVDAKNFQWRRLRRCSEARYAAYKILTEKYKYSSVDIGEMFRQDHTSVLYGLRRAAIMNGLNVEWTTMYGQALRELDAS